MLGRGRGHGGGGTEAGGRRRGDGAGRAPRPRSSAVPVRLAHWTGGSVGRPQQPPAESRLTACRRAWHSADSLQGRVAGIDGAGVEFTLRRGPRGWVRFTGRRVPWKPGSRPRFAPFTPRDPGRTADSPRLLLGGGNPHFRPPLRPGGGPSRNSTGEFSLRAGSCEAGTRVSEERRKDKVWDPSAREMVGCFLSGF